ncbi:MAG: glycosyl hydrolase [Alistipes sp.]
MKKLLNTLIFIVLSGYCSAQSTQLQREFNTPPQSIKTSVYWYWMCGNISKEGAIKDLEAMKEVGINRAFIGNIYFDPYEGGRNVKLMSDEWWDVTHTALKTATELGIDIGMFNAPGWTQAGGPWVKANEAMRYLSSSKLVVTGPAHLSTQLETPAGEFEDVKVIAYPISKESQRMLNRSNSTITVSPTLEHSDKMFDGNQVEGIGLPENVAVSIDICADTEFTARSLTIYPTHSNINATFELQAKVGTQFETRSSFVIDWFFLSNIVGFQPFAPVTMSIDETTAKEFRLLIKNRRNEGGVAEIELSSAPRIENYAGKTLAKMSQLPMPAWDYYTWREQPEANDTAVNIDPHQVLDLSPQMTAAGHLTWEVPAGDWVILRTGMTPTGVTNNPGGPDGTGLEIDKMSKRHVATHFDAYIGKILARIPAEDRKSLKMVVQDSYESGGENFTDDFLALFKARYGYDALPFLPTYFGYVVGSQEQSDRFLWDLRRFVADKVAYDYVGGFRELCHKHGLRTWLENYGHWGFPAEFLQYGGQSDEVAGEYWLPNAFPSWENDLGSIENRAASSCAHIYGKNIVTSESNTSGGPAFSRVPADAKQRTDKYFAEGVNSTLLHVYVHQPDLDRYPGTNAWFGTEFNRTNTWFSHIDLFLDYVRRCNYMLQQGLNIADVAYFIGEDAPKMTGIQDPALPAGYQFDYINAEVIIRDATLKNGLITLPHGTSYRVLVLPKTETMRPEVLAKIKQLVADGAVILGPAPTHSPSLENQPQADALVRQMATELWGEVDGIRKTAAQFGKGMVFNGVTLEEVFSRIGLIQDCGTPVGAPIQYGHRRLHKTDIYFITNQGDTRQKADLQFRVKGMQPELWDPITGKTRKLTEFVAKGQTTTLPLTLEPYQSAFIVFQKRGNPIAHTQNFPQATQTTDLTAAWRVDFQGKLTNPSSITLDKLQDIATLPNNNIKYFSGNMIYTTNVTVDLSNTQSRDVYLDLGEVHKMAKVWVNDRYVGGAWTPPYRVNISDALQQGQNRLRIDVVNTWVNRMIGDSALPKASRETWAGMSPYNPDSKLQKSGLIGPVQLKYIPNYK